MGGVRLREVVAHGSSTALLKYIRSFPVNTHVSDQLKLRPPL